MFFLLALMLTCSISTFAQEITAQEIVYKLSYEEVNPNQRLGLILQLENFPSLNTLDFLKELIELEPHSEPMREAGRIAHAIERHLTEEDPIILSLNFKKRSFVLRQAEFIARAKEEPWNGNREEYLRSYLFEKFLDFERQENQGKRVSESIYLGAKSPHIETDSELDRVTQAIFDFQMKPYNENPAQKEEQYQRIMQVYPMSPRVVQYFSEEKVRRYIWKKYEKEMKEEIQRSKQREARRNAFIYGIDQELIHKGRGRDDLGPALLRQRHVDLKAIYEEYRRINPVGKLNELIEQHSEFGYLVERRGVKSQRASFILPSLLEYKKLDPTHFDEAQKRQEAFYKELLSPEFVQVLREECFSIFNLAAGTNILARFFPNIDKDTLFKQATQILLGLDETSKDAETYEDRLQSNLDRQKIQIANALKDIQFSKHELTDILDFYFGTLLKILDSDSSTIYPPILSLGYAMAETKTRYYLAHQGDLVSQSNQVFAVRDAFWEFCGNILVIRLRDLIFSHLESRKKQFEEIYSQLSTQKDDVHKVDLFEKIVKEFESQYPAEFKYEEPSWVEEGKPRDSMAQQIEQWFFKEDKKLIKAETETFYDWSGTFPSLTVIQWMNLRDQEKFFAFHEERDGFRIAKRLQNDLVYQEFVKEAPEVGRLIIKKYHSLIQTFNDPEHLITEESVFEGFTDFKPFL